MTDAGAGGGAEEPPRGWLRLLLDPLFGAFFLGRALSSTGIWIHNITSAVLVFEITRSALTPISRAASKSSDAARTAIPNSVRRNTNAVSTSTRAVTTMVTMSITSTRMPPTSTVSNAHAGPSNAFFWGDTNTCQQACERRSSANDVYDSPKPNGQSGATGPST